MSKKRAPGRSLDEWMELVTECRQSGLTVFCKYKLPKNAEALP